MTEATFTISYINGNPGLVVRGEEAQEIDNLINAIMPVFRDFEKILKPAAPVPYQPEKAVEKPQSAVKVINNPIDDNVVCEIHRIKMTHYEKDGNEWWSHKRENGQYCNGRKRKYNQ